MSQFSVTDPERLSPRNGHLKIRSRRVLDAEAVIGQVFERRFDLKLSNAAELDFSLDHFPCGPGVSVSRMSFGAEASVRIERVECFMVQMPIAGRNDLVLDGGSPLLLSKSMFSVIGPGRSVNQHRHKDCEMILVRFDERQLLECLDAQLGRPHDSRCASGSLQFASGMPVAQPHSSAWLRLMSFIINELHKSDSIFLSSFAASQVSNLMMSTLLFNQPNNYSAMLQQPRCAVAPRIVRDAQDWIDSNAHRSITVDDVARAVKLSTRSLYTAFRKYLDQTPMDYVKDVRLRRVRDEFLLGVGKRSVTSIAMNWGFAHLGNFARDYRIKFGELPSQTLRGRHYE